MWWFYALLLALFAAFNTLLAKIGIKGVNSDLPTAIRTLFILFIAWGIVFARKETDGITLLSKNNWLFLRLSGVATELSLIFYFKALQLGKVSQVAPIDKLSVAIAIILSAMLLHEVITFKIIMGALLIHWRLDIDYFIGCYTNQFAHLISNKKGIQIKLLRGFYPFGE